VSSEEDVVIVGAGHAGGSAAALLRQHGWKGKITLIGTEPELPYQRPPLSKGWLKGEETAESLALRSARFYDDHAISLRLAQTVEAIDPAHRQVRLSDGEKIDYSWLILALGSRNRTLPVPGANLTGVLELRSAAHADLLKAALQPGTRLVVVGGGFIGLEVAASARKLGVDVTVVEREARLLPRVVCQQLSEFFAARHREAGVALLLGATVTGFEGNAGKVSAVHLDDGTILPCDTALVGIGAMAEDTLAREAGLVCDNGIVVDSQARTSDPHIFAVGDCTRRPLPLYDCAARLESVPNALEQANQAARAVCGLPGPAPEVPWFWSDQYDIRLQIAGLAFGSAKTTIHGDPATGKFAVFHLGDDDRVLAVEAVNLPQAMAIGKQMIIRRKTVSPARIADPSVSLKDLTR
jgi:3-phenylpropionate/trans-cinnamate dioxygenase ferredoxin reductase component